MLCMIREALRTLAEAHKRGYRVPAVGPMNAARRTLDLAVDKSERGCVPRQGKQ